MTFNMYIWFFLFIFFCAGVERASQSLGPLRYALNSPVKSHVAKRSLYQGDAYSSAGICKKNCIKYLYNVLYVYVTLGSICQLFNFRLMNHVSGNIYIYTHFKEVHTVKFWGGQGVSKPKMFKGREDERPFKPRITNNICRCYQWCYQLSV